MERKNLVKLVIPLIAGTSLIVGATIYSLVGNKELKMQQRQDAIIENLNQNPLVRTSSISEFRELYKLEEKNYDNGYGTHFAEKE